MLRKQAEAQRVEQMNAEVAAMQKEKEALMRRVRQLRKQIMEIPSNDVAEETVSKETVEEDVQKEINSKKTSKVVVEKKNNVSLISTACKHQWRVSNPIIYKLII